MDQKAFSLQELAHLTNCQLVGDPNHLIYNVADLDTASPREASFLANTRYLQAMSKSKAGVIFIDEHTSLIEGKNYLISSQPSNAFQQLIDSFHPQQKYPSAFVGIHPTAVIHETAKIGPHVTIGPHATIDANTCIGARTFIGSGVYIGIETIIGQDCLIHPRVVIREQCLIGNRVIIQPGAVIGSCGFGYTTNKHGEHTKLNQVGNVKISDNVEIGANTTIDRSRFKSTSIGQGSKIDNLVQLGHGVEVGEKNLIAAQTGIAGSTKTGESVFLGGHVGLAGHLQLNDGVKVAGKSGVSKSLLIKGEYGGMPAIPIAKYNRNQVFLKNIEVYIEQLKTIEQRLKKLESASIPPDSN